MLGAQSDSTLLHKPAVPPGYNSTIRIQQCHPARKVETMFTDTSGWLLLLVAYDVIAAVLGCILFAFLLED